MGNANTLLQRPKERLKYLVACAQEWSGKYQFTKDTKMFALLQIHLDIQGIFSNENHRRGKKKTLPY